MYAAVPYYACGVCAEVALIPAGWVARKPAKLSHEAAAALPYSASLAWNAVVRQARLDRHTTRGKRYPLSKNSRLWQILSITG